MERIRVGCSGRNYAHWREIFYPQGLPKKRWFAFYAEHFDTVEIKNSISCSDSFRASESTSNGSKDLESTSKRYLPCH
jgi:hypothetical protein